MDRRLSCWIRLAAALLAVPAVLVSTPALGQRWSPSRDDAVLAEPAPVGTGLRRVTTSLDGGPTRPLSVQRPSRLLPRSEQIGRLHIQADAPRARSASEGMVEELPPGAITGEVIQGGPVYEQGYYPEGGEYEAGYGGGYGDGCCGNTCCGDTCCGNWNSCGPVPLCCLLPRPNLDNFEIFAGVQSFSGPANRGGSGSFGFHEGFNNAQPFCCTSVCTQFGMAWTQSNPNGSFVTDDDRHQIFLTGGAFRRTDCGLQGGLVLDYLHDEWDYEFDVLALRGEVGWKCHPCSDVGFWFSTGLSDDRFASLGPENEQVETFTGQVNFAVNDLFAFYVRRQFACGGEGRLYGGFTDNNQGLVGGDVRVPLNPCWSLAANFLYVSPGDALEDRPDFVAESWNVSLTLIWRPFSRPGCTCHCRPLFEVANNGTLATTIE